MNKCFCRAQYIVRIYWRIILKWNVKKHKCYIAGSLVVMMMMMMNHRIPARKHVLEYVLKVQQRHCIWHTSPVS